MTTKYLIFLIFVGFLTPVYAQTSDYIETKLQIAKNFLSDKQYENALNELNKILEIDPDNVLALNEKGDIRLIQGKYVKALQNYEKILKLESRNLDALNGQATSLYHLEKSVPCGVSPVRAMSVRLK